MKNIRFIFGLFAILFVMTGCVESPQFKGVSNLKIDDVNKDKISFNLDVTAYNPNGYKLKVRKSSFDVYLNEQYIGEAFLLDKYKMKKKTTTLDNVPVEVLLEKGVIMKLMQIAMGGTVKLRMEGVLKASVIGFPVRKKIDQTKDFNMKDLNINFRDLIGF